MSILIQVIGIGIIGAIIVLLLKEVKPSFAVIVSLATCVLISLLVISQCQEIYIKIRDFLSKINYSSKVIVTALKVVGLGYIIEFASDIVEECGMTSISKKIVLAGKVIVAGICLPYIFDLFELIIGLV